MDVRGAAGVVAREDGLVADHTLLVTGLDTTEESSVQVAVVLGVSVAICDNTGVDTGGIAVPEVGVDLGDGFAGVDIDQLDVEVQGYTGLVLDQVLADEFTGDKVRTLGDLGLHDAGAAVLEELAGVAVEVDGLVRVVILGQHVVEVADLQVGSAQAGALLHAQVLDGALAARNVVCGDAAGLELARTVRQAAALKGNASQVSGTFSGLSLVVVAGMGRGNAGQTSKAEHKAGGELDHCRGTFAGNG